MCNQAGKGDPVAIRRQLPVDSPAADLRLATARNARAPGASARRPLSTAYQSKDPAELWRFYIQLVEIEANRRPPLAAVRNGHLATFTDADTGAAAGRRGMDRKAARDYHWCVSFRITGRVGGSERRESWSERQDLDLRPPRPERGALPATL
jgi:hypothetical protein